MNINWLLINIDALACFFIVVRLLFCEYAEKKNFFISIITYLLILASAWIPFRIWFGYYVQPDYAGCFINVFMCFCIWRAHGNLLKIKV